MHLFSLSERCRGRSRAPALHYSGPVAVLVGPACVSACEFFSYDMTINDRAIIVGQYPTEGAGGSVDQFVMPEGIYTQITIGREVDANSPTPGNWRRGRPAGGGRGVEPMIQEGPSLLLGVLAVRRS